jgi:glycosyltransferase involved in cell wall biosynthesis
MRVAYLVSRYPAVTHTFVLREVQLLRRLGLDVHTISIVRQSPAELLSPVDREEARSTFNVRPVRLGELLRAHAAAARTSPSGYLRTLALALRLSPGGGRAALWQFFYFVQAMRVWEHCRELGVRHLHVHFANVSADVAMLVVAFGNAAGRGGEWRWSFTLHGPTELSDTETHRLRQKAESAAFVACISDFARSQLMALVDPIHWERLHVVRLGVITGEAAEERREARGEEPRVLIVGQLARRKGHEVLLRALRQSRHRPHLTIVGDGPERARLERLAAILGLSSRVTFAGARGQDEVPGFYASATLFCLPSFQEGVPVVLMEAMARGIPVIATRVMGVPELVEDGESGVLVSPGRADELAAAIDALLDDPERAAVMGRAGRERVLARYDLEHNVREMARLFEAA